MKLKIQMSEGFHTTIWKQPIEIETDDYPQLKDMSSTEVLEFLNQKASNLPATPGSDPEEWSLYDELIGQESEVVKEKQFETEVHLWVP